MITIYGKQVTKIFSLKDRIIPILLGEDFTIEEGDFIFLTGRSGSGKTTFLKLLIREIKTDYGDIYYDNTSLSSLNEEQLAMLRTRIGVVFQDYRLISYKTVRENIEFVLEVLNTPKNERDETVERLLELVGLKDKQNYLPAYLSGGEQRRVSIARALATGPVVLLADEPTGDLDPVNTEIIVDILKRLHSENITIVMATHHIQLLDYFKNAKVWYLERGEIIKNLKPKELTKRYHSHKQLQDPLYEEFINILPDELRKKLLPLLPVSPKKLLSLTPRIYEEKLHLSPSQIQELAKILTKLIKKDTQ